MSPSPADTGWYLVQERRPLSESLLWDLQREYFAAMGVEAWRLGEVPHYVTSNPSMASSYAEVVLALFGDVPRQVRADDRLTVCELGAGSGRFAYYFLRHLSRLCEEAGLPPTSFRYVLTDVADGTLQFWRRHPRFQAYFESGVLDVARFDVIDGHELDLECSGETIGVGGLALPLVVIANYVFDSIPQDLFYVDGGVVHDCLVALFVEEDPATLDVATLLAELDVRYDTEARDGTPYPERYLQRILAEYERTLTDAHVLFPAAGIRCLERLRALSRRGLAVLSADKGDHRLGALDRAPAPTLTHHGSFSLSVNYHALRTYCEQRGGISLFPTSHYSSINVGCLLLVDEAEGYHRTVRAYQRHVEEFSPDDFFTISTHARRYMAEMTVVEILAYLRMSFYDSHLFGRYLPRLLELAPEADDSERQSIRDVAERVWQWHFPLGEELDLAHGIACLLYEVDDFAGALEFFERSVEIYGEDTGTLYNMAVCLDFLGQRDRAEPLLRKVLRHDPDNHAAAELLAEIARR